MRSDLHSGQDGSELRDLTRFELTELPTPVHPLASLSGVLEGPEIWIKRDDLTTLAMGGNKTRKLEYLLADALDRGADTLITPGSVQSNHCRQTAAAAVRASLECHLVLNGLGDDGESAQGNLLLDQLMGATIHSVERTGRDAAMERVAEVCRASGKEPYVIPVGGSNGTGALGYVNAFREMNRQAAELGIGFDRIVFASSSGGTQAGLQLGAEIEGYTGTITGISIDQTRIDLPDYREHMAGICAESANLLGIDTEIGPGSFDLCLDYLGDGYGIMGETELDAIRMLAETEAILVGPVYTGRAMGALIDLIHRGEIDPGERVLFWHTGDTPTLFAYSAELLPST
jgi:D-cysteine desulfhydrase